MTHPPTHSLTGVKCRATIEAKNEKKLSYSIYYYGKPEHEVEADSHYSHPRQVMNDLDDASLSD